MNKDIYTNNYDKERAGLVDCEKPCKVEVGDASFLCKVSYMHSCADFGSAAKMHISKLGQGVCGLSVCE